MAEALKTRPAGEDQRVDEEATVVDVRIEKVFGSHNVYEFDRKRSALRLARFVTGDGACEVEQGTAQRTLANGEPLPALLLTRAPTFPDCLVRARILGAVRAGDAPPWLVGVPEAAAQDGVETIADLPEETRTAVRSIVADVAADESLSWLDPSGAASVVKAARESYWVEKAQAEGAARYGAAWKVTPGAGMRKADALPAHTVAEYLLPSLPSRFLKYVEEELLPGERIRLPAKSLRRSCSGHRERSSSDWRIRRDERSPSWSGPPHAQPVSGAHSTWRRPFRLWRRSQQSASVGSAFAFPIFRSCLSGSRPKLRPLSWNRIGVSFNIFMTNWRSSSARPTSDFATSRGEASRLPGSVRRTPCPGTGYLTNAGGKPTCRCQSATSQRTPSNPASCGFADTIAAVAGQPEKIQ